MAGVEMNRAQTCRQTLFGLLVVLLLLGRAVAVRGAEGDPTKPARFSVPLEYREHPDATPLVSLAFDSEGSFVKEPAVSGARWQRGRLKTGSQPLSFMLDQTHGKLYLDLNRNLDLTDDPAGVFAADTKAPYQAFPGVRFEVDTPTGRCPFLVDLQFYDYGASRIGGWVALRSSFFGRLELQGRPWEVGLVKNPFEPLDSAEGTQLLLRRWESAESAPTSAPILGEALAFRTNLFLQGEAFRAASAFPTGGGKPAFELRLERLDPPLGEIRITGKYVQRLVLQDGNDWLVVLDEPAASVRVPAASYAHHRVLLQRDGARAQADNHQILRVSPDSSAVLSAGGPLTNVVQVSRRGRALRLDYVLQGSGGRRYQLAGSGSSAAPEFVILQGDRRLASGKFEFG